jgi:hypothetical protein
MLRIAVGIDDLRRITIEVPNTELASDKIASEPARRAQQRLIGKQVSERLGRRRDVESCSSQREVAVTAFKVELTSKHHSHRKLLLSLAFSVTERLGRKEFELTIKDSAPERFREERVVRFRWPFLAHRWVQQPIETIAQADQRRDTAA